MNIRLLEKTRQHILEHPEELNMGLWCGCIAGHICRQAGLSSLEEHEIGEEAEILVKGDLFYEWRKMGLLREQNSIVFRNDWF